jgi:two-component system, chemotaxis family, sensor kinase Cph1
MQPMSPELDLSRCADEPIHIPGSIQPHGVLLALDTSLNSVAWISANSADILGLRPDELFGRTVSNLFDEVSLGRLDEAFHCTTPRRFGPVPVRMGEREFDAIMHRAQQFTIVELESPLEEWALPPDLFSDVEQAVERLAQSIPRGAIWQAVAEEIRRVTHFDRVMVYQFHEDEHGEVIAEARAEEMEPYLHLHYPATDIPAQARRLYRLNWLRLIVDTKAKPVPLIASPPLTNREPLDLSYAVLRSVSPVHIEYLHNMGVRASMSVSLVVRDRLWGLIACHHRTPRHLPYRLRSWCELLARILSWQIELVHCTGRARDRARATNIIAALVRGAAETDDVLDALTRRQPSVLDLVNASGAAAIWNERCDLLGLTPSESDVLALVDWLASNVENRVFVTDHLAAHWPPAQKLASVAAGLLALRISKDHGPIVLWFRPEHIRTIAWGGDPTKPAILNPMSGEIGPRNSFEIWKSAVVGRAEPWIDWEIDAAEALEGPVAKAMLRHMEEVERHNRELRDALQARDLFLAMASHELRTPISALKLQLDGLARAAERAPNTTLNSSQLAPRLELLKRQTAKLSRIMDEILDAARMSADRFELSAEMTDLSDIVREIVERDHEEIRRLGCTLVLHLGTQIRGQWDRSRLGQVIGNLLSNASRYGAGQPITITVTRTANEAVLRVRDEGIGIPAKDQGLIFERFQRAVSPRHYQGLGLGLWLAREIVTRMGGRIEVHSAPSKGAEFVVTLPLESHRENVHDAGPTQGQGR